jgi:hypothetical protein
MSPHAPIQTDPEDGGKQRVAMTRRELAREPLRRLADMEF